MRRLSEDDGLPSEMALLLDAEDIDQSSVEISGQTMDTTMRTHNRRNLVAYWILGLCNNYGYVVMLSAAHDILSTKDKAASIDPIPEFFNETTNARDCNPVSTGAILLADILPSLFIKLIAPFLPFYVHVRIFIVILLSCAGFILVAVSSTQWLAILGVVSTSLASGLGEVTFMSYSSLFHTNVVSTWSSGTGGAGVFGSFSYAGLTSLGLSPSTSLYLMLVVPVAMGVTFWGVMTHPKPLTVCQSRKSREDAAASRAIVREEVHEATENSTEAGPTPSVMEKLAAIPPLFKFMIPLGLVYFFEYFINQGLFELIYYEDIWLDHHEQYRWLQVDYQIGVFISRSSVNLFQIEKLWILAVLQGLNVIFFTAEVVTYFVPTIWIIFGAVLWEGLLGGASYVNTFYRISHEIPAERREFSLGITCLSDAIGIALAGFSAIPAHNFLCNLPLPSRN